jgi:DtxR family Mn-dependent transcriptional regulator
VADKAVVRIVHIEDEPPAVYAQLAAQGLHTGMQIKVLESRPDRILFEAHGEESVLAPLLARNITVEPLPEERQFRGPFRTLASVRSGERAIVQSISRACRGAQRRRLMDMGIVPGTPIEPELDSLTGDPVAYRVRGTLIALRRQQADQILVRSPENDT